MNNDGPIRHKLGVCEGLWLAGLLLDEAATLDQARASIKAAGMAATAEAQRMSGPVKKAA
jgi:hypothetical protein